MIDKITEHLKAKHPSSKNFYGIFYEYEYLIKNSKQNIGSIWRKLALLMDRQIRMNAVFINRNIASNIVSII